MLLDPDIRALVRERCAGLPPMTVVLEEFVLGSCIADVVTVTSDTFEAIEIKSDGDSLRRLARQARAYENVVTTAWLAVGPRLLRGAKREIPQWWGILAAEPGALHIERPARPNPEVEIASVCMMLWRGEMREILRAAGDHALARRDKASMGERMCEMRTLPELRAIIYDHFLVRKWWERRAKNAHRLRVIGRAA